jgi:SIR2-like protein
MKNTTLFIGSGVSYSSGIPSLSTITDSLLYSNKIGCDGDTNYYFEGYRGYEIQDYLIGYVESCQHLLNLIKSKIDRFYEHIDFKHKTNYEDIYYVLRQIKDSYILEYENPAIISLIEELLKEMSGSAKDFEEIVVESSRFIESLVWQSIDIEIKQTSQFELIKYLINYCGLESIISLNYDIVLETWLNGNKIKFDDGFQLKDKKLPEWTGFKRKNDVLKLCKVHGSVDWFEFRITKPGTYDNLVKVPRNYYAERVHEIDDSFMAPNSGRPSILIGTFNKMWGYLGGIHELLYDELKLTISTSEIIIISGYGFGDKGINTQLTNWLFRKHAKNMIIIHPNKDSLIKNSRGSFKNNILNDHYCHTKVILIEKRFEKVQIQELKEYCA